VRRALDADPHTGQRRWAPQAFRYAGYHDAELGYAVTDHAAQGRTVTAGQQLSATQTRHQALPDADHLAILHAIWTAETTPARHQQYKDLLMNALPPGHRAEPGHQARWLWRTLRATVSVIRDSHKKSVTRMTTQVYAWLAPRDYARTS